MSMYTSLFDPPLLHEVEYAVSNLGRISHDVDEYMDENTQNFIGPLEKICQTRTF
jgi:hypothetical protein